MIAEYVHQNRIVNPKILYKKPYHHQKATTVKANMG